MSGEIGRSGPRLRDLGKKVPHCPDPDSGELLLTVQSASAGQIPKKISEKVVPV